MKYGTIKFIEELLKREEETRIEAVKIVSKELHEQEKSSGIGTWEKGNDLIEFYRELVSEARDMVTEIRLVRSDWGNKDWC